MVGGIQEISQSNLLFVAQAFSRESLLFSSSEGWKQQRGQYRDNCYHDQQLDQRKGTQLGACPRERWFGGQCHKSCRIVTPIHCQRCCGGGQASGHASISWSEEAIRRSESSGLSPKGQRTASMAGRLRLVAALAFRNEKTLNSGLGYTTIAIGPGLK